MSGGIYGGGKCIDIAKRHYSPLCSFVVSSQIEVELPPIKVVVLTNDCLDDVGALVFDAGSHSFRAGFAGEEYPKVFTTTLNQRFYSSIFRRTSASE